MTRFPDAADTLSVWCAVAGLGLRMARHPRAGGFVFLVASFGYLGILHERIASARISGYRHGKYDNLNASQLLLHGALLVAGYDWVTR